MHRPGGVPVARQLVSRVETGLGYSAGVSQLPLDYGSRCREGGKYCEGLANEL